MRVKLLQICLVVIAAVAAASLLSQSNPDKHDKHSRVIPDPVVQPAAVPFAIDSRRPDFLHTLQVLSPDEMTRHDRDLTADAESSIHERAGFENLEFNQGQWTYTQLICPALPNHLLLRFTRDDGIRATSMFSAAIPRTGEGRVRIIPIVRKGYSLFSPAPIGPLTIAVFNHIRAEENPDPAPDWLMVGMCYAALAGANPRTETLPSNKDDARGLPLTAPPTLFVKQDGSTTISFDDMSIAPRPTRWNLFFDRKGKLLKATHAPVDATNHRERTVPAAEIEEPAHP